MKIIAITPHEKWDTLAALIIEGLQDLNITIIATDYGNGIQKTYPDEEVINHSKDADYVFAFWGKHGANGVPSPKYYLLDKINRPDITCYIDGSEYNYTGYPNSSNNNRQIRGEPWINEDLYNKCSLYFKRLVLQEDLGRKKIIPCYIGALNSYFTTTDNDTSHKEHDFYCSFGGDAGHTGTGLRLPVYEHLQSLNNPNAIVGKKFNHKEYLDTISKSFIGISAWGAGNCCRRMWEIISNRTCCFIQKPFIIYPNQFIDGESCVYYESEEEFKDKLNFYLKNKEECIRIGNNGHDHTKKYHTGTKRVEYIIKKFSTKSY